MSNNNDYGDHSDIINLHHNDNNDNNIHDNNDNNVAATQCCHGTMSGTGDTRKKC